MQVEQQIYRAGHGWEGAADGLALKDGAQLVLVFAARALLQDAALMQTIQNNYPKADVVFASTAGEIHASEVSDDTLICTAIQFEHTRLRSECVSIENMSDSRAVGEKLGASLFADDLSYVLIIAEGLNINGSELVLGLRESLPASIPVTGGLAGDGADFGTTLVGLNGMPQSSQIVAIGFYGEQLRVGHGSYGGWDSFGPEREITRAESNVLYEIDGQSALALYKRYLGDKADGLPGTGLLFPLSIQQANQAQPIVRTLLAVDEDAQSMTFVGDMPVGAKVKLMCAHFERLIDGATTAAENSLDQETATPDTVDLVLGISCVGRKLILGQQIDEEIESLRDVFGEQPYFTGFYSYGEISPSMTGSACELHNQTMTVTTFREVSPE